MHNMCDVIFDLPFSGPPELPRDCDVHNHTTMGLAVTW